MTAKEMKDQFCTRIYELRSKENLSLTELAHRSGLPLKMLESLECGVVPEEMMVDDAFDLAKALHCKIYELFK